MKSVLITGGSGSFGRAFVRAALADKVASRIGILSREEHAQADMAEEHGHDDRLRFFIGDVRDRDRLRRAFSGFEVVVHAAALKRIEVGFYNPTEMVLTNINGAINVIEAARCNGVKKVIALSSDKAWQPISPYGQSKALAETLFRHHSGGETRFAVTRYGNVWLSRGSVAPKWSEILRKTDTVPVTDPDATRFFMWMSEAVSLVMRTIKDMKGGDLVIPKLPAYRLGDLAEAMGARMKIVGMPEYEKKHEGMAEGNSSDKATRLSVKGLREILNASGLHCASQDGLYAPPRKSLASAQRPYGDWRGIDPLQANTGARRDDNCGSVRPS